MTGKKVRFALAVIGGIAHNLQDPSGAFAVITSVQEYDGMLYLGSLLEEAFGRIPVPVVAPEAQ